MKRDKKSDEKFGKKTQGLQLIFLTCLCLTIVTCVRSKSITAPLSDDTDNIQLIAADDVNISSTVSLDVEDFTESASSLEKRAEKNRQTIERNVINLNGKLSLSINNPTSITEPSTIDDRQTTDWTTTIGTTDSSISTSEESTKFSNEVWTSNTGHTLTSTSAAETKGETITESTTDISSSTFTESTISSETETTAETNTPITEDDETPTTTLTPMTTSAEPTTPVVTTTMSLMPTLTTTTKVETRTTQLSLPTLTLTTTSTTTMLPTMTTSESTPLPMSISTTETYLMATTAEMETTPIVSTTSTAKINETTILTALSKSTPQSSTMLSVLFTAETPITVSSIESTTKAKTTTTTVETKTDSTSQNTSSTNVTNTTMSTKSLSPKEITLLIRIVFKGSWHSVCKELQSIRQSLLDMVNNNVNKSKITLEQIVFHKTQCMNNSSMTMNTSMTQENESTPLYFYIIDQNGNLDRNLTEIMRSYYETSNVSFPLSIQSLELVEGVEEDNVNSENNTTVIIIASCVCVLCLFLLGGLIFVMRKRRGRFNYGERCRPVFLDGFSLDSVSAYSSVRRSKFSLGASKRSYGNPTFEDSNTIPSHPLNFAGLASFCNDLNGIADEFSGIAQVSSKIDELPAGAEVKNRYANVIPLPETRVPLQRLNNDPQTEYINASYVRGPKNANKYYIAAQAPTDNTVCDFWRMIWEQQVKVIIMLTDLVENDVEKCVEYIPPLEVSDCHRLYGDYQVTLKKREAKDKYAISSLQLKNLENNTFREVIHFWYLWPTNGVPSDPSTLMSVLLESRAFQRGASSPILIHCSPGTGRTGTLIALDLVVRQYEVTRTIDVPRIVYTIRRDRAGAVQTKEQYTFIYQAINHYAKKLVGGTVDMN